MADVGFRPSSKLCGKQANRYHLQTKCWQTERISESGFVSAGYLLTVPSTLIATLLLHHLVELNMLAIRAVSQNMAKRKQTCLIAATQSAA